MSQRKNLATDHPIARDILNELKLYAKDNQYYLVQYALFTYMTKPRRSPRTNKIIPPLYPNLKRGQFDYQFKRLVEDGFIAIDPVSRAIRCTDLEIVEAEAREVD